MSGKLRTADDYPDTVSLLKHRIGDLQAELARVTAERDAAEEQRRSECTRANSIVAHIHRICNDVGFPRRGNHPDAAVRGDRTPDSRGTFEWRIENGVKELRVQLNEALDVLRQGSELRTDQHDFIAKFTAWCFRAGAILA